MKLLGVHCQLVSFCQQACSIGVATTDAQMPKHSKGGNSGDGKHSVMLQHKLSFVGSTVPVPLLEMRARLLHPHINRSMSPCRVLMCKQFRHQDNAAPNDNCGLLRRRKTRLVKARAACS